MLRVCGKCIFELLPILSVAFRLFFDSSLYIDIFYTVFFVLKDELGGLQYVQMIIIDNLIFGRKWCCRDSEQTGATYSIFQVQSLVYFEHEKFIISAATSLKMRYT